jgi:hypothetical protein
MDGLGGDSRKLTGAGSVVDFFGSEISLRVSDFSLLIIGAKCPMIKS